ncbi:uncharacterized protein EI90DRAFT_3070242 [Cantharellus anzutake]|uniref:uncharacterized protein n=1 Tax=Cantharellus anzutake TaxID=1750568 RepID=UPI001904779F|nr:uncharacterized protein EI90DRAFT_3070242 [Cantharellus anzutake]KAF8326298.1 hypothetical protein EI90DRAFT_3070242 [Cantharellus anzutake]
MGRLSFLAHLVSILHSQRSRHFPADRVADFPRPRLISCCVRCYLNASCVIGHTHGKRYRSGCPLRRLEPSTAQDLLCANILRKRG